MPMKHRPAALGALAIALTLLLFTQPVCAASTSQLAIDGGQLSIWWVIPFVGLLLSIAVMPLRAGEFWDMHFGKVSAFWGLCLVVPMLFYAGFQTTLYEVLHVYLLEYMPFIILLLALFTISGGVCVTGSLKGSPGSNVVMLLVATALASFMGTTGAAMLMIRPMLRANAWRRKKVHTIVFFIFLVCNVGGALTPLGDPPLFLGFLQGVSFFWTTTHLWWEMLFVVVLLLALYYGWDRLLFRQERRPEMEQERQPIGLTGTFNLLLLAAVIGFVLFSGIADLGVITVYHVALPIAGLIRDAGLLALTWVSWQTTSRANRDANDFSWNAILEVGYLFAGIFITIVAPLAMLAAAQHGQGALQFVSGALFNAAGEPNNIVFFWMTGVLSSLLDNAPTYLIFFDAAGGNAQLLMTRMAETLVAISAGAVFFGAVTYIGNAPNFMVKSIAEEAGVDMPSFGGYMLWSIGILIPIYVLVTLLFF